MRPRRSAEIVDSETHPRGQNFHSWAIVISSVVTLILLVLVSVLCVGSNKNVTEPTSKLVIIFIIALCIYFLKLLGLLQIVLPR